MRASSKRTGKKRRTATAEDVERRFWDTHDATEAFEWSRAVEPVFPSLRPSTT